MEQMAMTCVQIITFVGTAKSKYMEAIQEAKAGEFETAEKLMTEGREVYLEGHKVHFELIQKESGGEKLELSILLMHAEDQLMAAETVRLMADEFIALYKKVLN